MRIKLLESKPNNESKQSKGNHTPSNSSDQPVNVQAEESKVLTVTIYVKIILNTLKRMTRKLIIIHWTNYWRPFKFVCVEENPICGQS